MSEADERALRGAVGPTSRRIMFNHLAILMSLLTAWEVGVRTGTLDALFFPLPTDILAGFWRLYVVQGNVWSHLGLTMMEVSIGFLAGSALGIGLAVVVGLVEPLRRYMKPYVIITEATPRIAIGPVIIAAFGFGWTSKVAIVMLVCFFAPFVNTLNGMVNVDDDELDMMRSMRASKLQIFRKLMIPDAMPEIMGGLRLAMASALGGALVAEFIAANAGMGVLINQYTGVLNMASAFVCVLTLTAIGFFILRFMEAVDRWLVFWGDRARTEAVSRRRASAWARREEGRT
ncbi:ABC transporter permease [Meridianimarinicoccus roseus]|jgi:NitT/TauT family transport system permease protein|uniref:ABC transporter permease n=1 Tax=Meridianimarinicoccus roseus TaxID=2072018 RepID=A0A2V2LMP8_9RHOB|nr:ABC transporter permease [Meridianimarinicoccus roseus]PWR04327.1 ABC transporter permease [Meridianimarinicoccus roseus]